MPYSSKDIKDIGKARILFMGPSKSGKTVAIALTAPQPIFFLNFDKGGLIGPSRLKATFEAEDIFDIKTLDTTLTYVEKEMKGKEPFRTVVFDPLSTFGRMVEAELRRRGLDGWDLWREFDHVVNGMFTRVMGLNAHVIFTCHADQAADDGGGETGHLPVFPGKNKHLIPAQLNDILWLEVTPGKDKEPTKREFLINAQGRWKHGCRSLSFVGRIPADFTAFLKRAEIKP